MTPPTVGMVLFPGLTELDLTGPLQVFCAVPNAVVHLVAATMDPVSTDTVMCINPTITMAECPQLDVICVPGGRGVDAILGDETVLDFLVTQAAGARYVTSVCTGALALGAAGLLRGYRATTHWTAMDCLAPFGAIPTEARVVVDRDRVTGGGVTAGIDFALTLVAELVDRPTAEAIQLRLEYAPEPPFASGSPRTAPADVVARYRDRIAPDAERRAVAVARAAALLA